MSNKTKVWKFWVRSGWKAWWKLLTQRKKGKVSWSPVLDSSDWIMLTMLHVILSSTKTMFIREKFTVLYLNEFRFWSLETKSALWYIFASLGQVFVSHNGWILQYEWVYKKDGTWTESLVEIKPGVYILILEATFIIFGFIIDSQKSLLSLYLRHLGVTFLT